MSAIGTWCLRASPQVWAMTVVYVVRFAQALGWFFERESWLLVRVSASCRDAGREPLEELGFEIL
jgi:hypothetical protein